MTTTILSPSSTKEAPVLLDKSFTSAISESYGTIDIRVVVLQKRPQQSQPEPETPLDAEEGEIFLSDTGKSPLAGYLEDPKRGKECIVFLVNGQRQVVPNRVQPGPQRLVGQIADAHAGRGDVNPFTLS